MPKNLPPLDWPFKPAPVRYFGPDVTYEVRCKINLARFIDALRVLNS